LGRLEIAKLNDGTDSTEIWKERCSLRGYSKGKLLIPAVNNNNMADMRNFEKAVKLTDRLCSLVVRVLGYRSGGPGSIPGTTKKK
jgi:hypothetical protein